MAKIKTPQVGPTRVKATYQMAPAALKILELERLKRIERGARRESASLSSLVNEAIGLAAAGAWHRRSY